MAYENPYTGPTLTGFNSSPPSDDGQRTASNVVRWATHLAKIGNPLRSYAQAISAAVLAAFDLLPSKLALAGIPALNTPERYGAIGNGVAIDLAAVQAAFDAGGDVYLSQTYFLGTFNQANTEVTVLTVTGKSNCRFYGPGTLKVTSENSCVPRIIDVDDTHNCVFDLNFTDTGFDDSILYQGAIAVNLVCAVGDVYANTFRLRGNNLVCGTSTGNQAATTPAFEAYDNHYECTFQDVYYGKQGRNCGDNSTGHVKTVRAHRSLFYYGCSYNRIDVMSDIHPLGYEQDVLIKVYDGRDTRGNKIKYTCTNFAAATACVYIGNATTSGKVVVDNEIECNDIDPTNSNTFSVFIQSTSGSPEVGDTTTTKVITNLKISGHCRFIPHVATSFQNPLYRNQLLIEVEGDIARKLTSVRPIVYGWGGVPMAGVTNATFNTRWKIGDKIHTIYTGLINSATIDVPLAQNSVVSVPVELFVNDAIFSSSGHQHRQNTYFVTAPTAEGNLPTVFGTATDFDSNNGVLGTITPGTAVADAEVVSAVRFTFSGWQTAPNGASGYIRVVHPDLSRDETDN